jgi:hypothetical protein
LRDICGNDIGHNLRRTAQGANYKGSDCWETTRSVKQHAEVFPE